MNYYEHHLGDYMRDTAHLSLIEDGVYRRLIDAYYAREKPLPNDLNECCKLARVSAAKSEREAVAYVLREFFQQESDGYHQKRCDEVIAKFHEKSAKARESARASVESRRRSAERIASERSANAERTLSGRSAPNLQSPVTSNQSPEETLRVSGASMLREGEMSAALRKVGVTVTSINPTLVAWVRDKFSIAQVLEAVDVARVNKPEGSIPANYIDRILREPARPPPKSQFERSTWRPPPDEATG